MDIRISFIFSASILVLVACGGGTINSPDDLQNKKNVIQNQLAVAEDALLGYWVPKNLANDEFEFLPSATEWPKNPRLKTGRIFNQGFITARFYWELRGDGTIDINVVDVGCQSRPLNNCHVNKNISIALTGDTVKNSKWSVIYRNPDNSILSTNSDVYTQKDINLANLKVDEFYLTKTKDFGTPLSGRYANNRFFIRLDELSKQIEISADAPNIASANIKFSSDEVVNTTREFYVEGIGYKEIPIRQRYDNVRLIASEDNHYILTYELRSEIVVPADTNSDAIRRDDFLETIKETQILELISGFSPSPAIGSFEKYYSYIPIDFNKTGDVDNNEIDFESSNGGFIKHTDLFDETRAAKQKFTWTQGDNSQILLNVDTFGEIAIKFISPVAGGYKVIFRWSDSTFGERYLIHDFLRDTYPLINNEDFPGIFKFISSDGWSEQEIIFHQDGTISSNPNLVGGFWFRDSNGDVVSFECSSTLGILMKSYNQCLSSFNNLSSVSFAHIRRLHILNKSGNDYKIKYDAIYFGDRYFITGDNYSIVSWTYNWIRVGNESK